MLISLEYLIDLVSQLFCVFLISLGSLVSLILLVLLISLESLISVEFPKIIGIPDILVISILIPGRYVEQVRLSRATLEFQVLQVPTGLKVFNSQVIYLISFTKLFRSKKSSIQNLSLPKKAEF